MERLLITAIVLAIPVYFYTSSLANIDRFEKKPLPSLINAFACGSILAITFSQILPHIFSISAPPIFSEATWEDSPLKALIGIAVTQEILKGIVVAIIYLRCRREFNGWVDGIVYGATVGLGFAYVDNIFDLTNQTDSWVEWIQVFFSHSLVFCGMEAFWTGLVGIGFGFTRYTHVTSQKVIVILSGLIAAILAHVIHNIALILIQEKLWLMSLFNYMALALLAILLLLANRYIARQRLRIYLSDEVPDFLSFECYEALCLSDQNRFTFLGISREQRRALFQVAENLVQKKMQLIEMGAAGSHSVEIAGLRQELRRLGNGDWGTDS